MFKKLGKPLLLHVYRSQMRCLSHLVSLLLLPEASPVRCFGHVSPAGGPEDNPGDTGETLSPGRPGNALGSLRTAD